jgi:hypothetical protein
MLDSLGSAEPLASYDGLNITELDDAMILAAFAALELDPGQTAQVLAALSGYIQEQENVWQDLVNDADNYLGAERKRNALLNYRRLLYLNRSSKRNKPRRVTSSPAVPAWTF